MATAEKTELIPAEAEQSISSEVLSLKTRADMMMTAFFANPQKRGSGWGDIVDMSNRVDLDDFISYRRNLVPENWRDENQRQITDGLIQEIDALVDVESRAQHHIHLTMFAQTYAGALLEIRKTKKKEEPTKVNEFKLGYFLAGVQTGVPIAMKHSLFFACVASEYGNLALSETDTNRRKVFLQRARFFHQASLFEGKLSGDTAFKGDESRGGPPAVAAGETAELPAFLEGYELPEGYQWVDFPNESEQEVALGEREGSTVACYIQGFGVRLTRGPGDITYVQFLGISLPRDIASTQQGIPLSESEERPLIIQAGDSRENSIQLRRKDRFDFLMLPFQTMIKYGNKDFTIPDLGSLGISFRMRPTENSRGNIWIRNENINYGSVDRIAIPSTAIVKGGGVAAAETSLVAGVERQTAAVPPPTEKTTIKAPEGEHTPLAEAFKRDCVGAGYNIFQLVDVQMSRATPGVFRPLRPPIFWGSSDSHRPIHDYVMSATGKEYAVEKRMRELWNMQQGSRVPETDPRYYRVGNSIVVLSDGEDNRSFLTIYGSISAEVAGSWIGGRTNHNNSVVFELEGHDAIDKFLAAVDDHARAYEDGTERNYKAIVKAMSGVFPKEAMAFTESHMFHRQEIQEVIDLRKSPPKREAAQAETVLTSEERMMIGGLGIVAAWERNEPNAKLTDFAKFSGETNEQHLQTTFRNLQFSFYLLPADSKVRAEIIKSALGQLGETGEKLKKAGKNDEEIFAEWLRQVFLALYQRANRGEIGSGP